MFAPEPGMAPDPMMEQEMMGMPQEAPAEEAPEDPVEVLRAILAGVKQYMEAEQDEEEREKGARILALVQSLIAANQKQNDQLMGASPAAKALRKTYAG